MILLRTIDELAESSETSRLAKVLDRIIFVFLVLMVLFAPHSIAATQSAWLIGMLAWVIRLFVSPRPRPRLTSVGIALFALFGWSAISSFFSYEPLVSIDKLRAVAVFLVFVYALNAIKNRRTAYLLAALLIGSCMISVAWTPIQKIIGRGVEVHGIIPGSALDQLKIVEGDTLLRVNRKRISSPSDILDALAQQPTAKLEAHRSDYSVFVEIRREQLAEGDAATALGFTSWNRSSNFRAAGFYGHYTTYAEVLQLIGALIFGLLVASLMLRAGTSRVAILAVCLTATAFALLLTVTRASQLGFIISSMVIVLLGASRKFVLIAVAIAVPLSMVGLYVLQSQRKVGFFDGNDGSIQYRQMMLRDGYRLLKENPRHLLVGVGLDSIKTHWEEWGMYDKGFQPMGHFHSTPLQLAVERGLPALLIWIIVLALYARTLWRALKRSGPDWRLRGILLGCLGGLAGFVASGMVHYNLGDAEVAMIFYFLMALGVKLSLLDREEILLIDSPLLKIDDRPDNFA